MMPNNRNHNTDFGETKYMVSKTLLFALFIDFERSASLEVSRKTLYCQKQKNFQKINKLSANN